METWLFKAKLRSEPASAYRLMSRSVTERAAPRRVNGATTCKAECIQHVAIPRERLNGTTVFTLIEKETGLLTPLDIGLETQCAFQENDTSVLAIPGEPLPVGKMELGPRHLFNIAAETQHYSVGDVSLTRTLRRFSVSCFH